MSRPPSQPSSAEGRPAAAAREVRGGAHDVRVDARGLLCPVPVLLAAREIAKLSAGGRLLVEGDDLGILEDLPAWCVETGHRLVAIGEESGLVRGVVEKAGGGAVGHPAGSPADSRAGMSIGPPRDQRDQRRP